MSIHTLPDDERAAIESEMEAARINFERWRSIHRRHQPTLREEYPDKYAGLKADEARDRAESEGGED